jgi:uncharacterized protein YbaR (Trm112 family)/SAM-dependent methyltransferase
MRAELLDILVCPLCGGPLVLEPRAFLEREGDEIVTGRLNCPCYAYPVLGGIPYLRAGARAEAALCLLEAGAAEKALFRALGLGAAGQTRFREMARDKRLWTFRNALALLSPEAEGVYFLYRYSDPTFVCGQAVLGAFGADPRCWSGRVLDVGGGVGHFTGTLCRLAGGRDVLLADGDFWRVWLAKLFLAPGCQPVCCTAHQPLPFVPGAFSLVFCSDAFHFVRSKWLLAGEMQRLLAHDGLILLAHLHNALCENPSPGWPLAPADYRRLFAALPTRLFKESTVLDSLCGRRPLDLSADHADRELEQEPAVLLTATRLTGLFKVYPATPRGGGGTARTLNPLYARDPADSAPVWRLRFPSPEYEREFAACRRYLPERVTLPEADLEALRGGRLDGRLLEYAERFVLLELPAGYC